MKHFWSDPVSGPVNRIRTPDPVRSGFENPINHFDSVSILSSNISYELYSDCQLLKKIAYSFKSYIFLMSFL